MSFSASILIGVKSFWRIQTEGVMAWINIGLLLFFVAFIVASLTMRQEFLGELFLNLAAETAGVWVAVMLIGEVLHRDQEKRAAPARIAALRRIRNIHDKISRLWKLLVLQKASVDRMRQVILDENDIKFFDEQLADAINQVDLSSSDTLTSTEKPMSTIASGWASIIKRDIELVTQGYGQYLSSSMLVALGDVEDNPFIARLADDLDQFLHEMEPPHNRDGISYQPKMTWVIGTHWYKDFIPAINELGRVIAAEIAAMPDTGDASDGSIGGQFPRLADFDPECKDKLERIRHFLNPERYKSSHDTEASDD